MAHLRRFGAAAIVALCGIAAIAWADEAAAPGAAASIVARKALMQSIEELLAQLEADLASGLIRGDQVVTSTNAIAAMLDTFPLLFPKESDLLGNKTALGAVTTSADPRIWNDFPAFAALSHKAATTAKAAAVAEPVATLPRLRETCSGCHTQYLYYDPFALPAP